MSLSYILGLLKKFTKHYCPISAKISNFETNKSRLITFSTFFGLNLLQNLTKMSSTGVGVEGGLGKMKFIGIDS